MNYIIPDGIIEIEWIEVRDVHGRLLCKVTPDLKHVQVKQRKSIMVARLPEANRENLNSSLHS